MTWTDELVGLVEDAVRQDRRGHPDWLPVIKHWEEKERRLWHERVRYICGCHALERANERRWEQLREQGLSPEDAIRTIFPVDAANILLGNRLKRFA